MKGGEEGHTPKNKRTPCPSFHPPTHRGGGGEGSERAICQMGRQGRQSFAPAGMQSSGAEQRNKAEQEQSRAKLMEQKGQGGKKASMVWFVFGCRSVCGRGRREKNGPLAHWQRAERMKE